MMSSEKLTVALVLALFSNALLLCLVLLQAGSSMWCGLGGNFRSSSRPLLRVDNRPRTADGDLVPGVSDYNRIPPRGVSISSEVERTELKRDPEQFGTSLKILEYSMAQKEDFDQDPPRFRLMKEGPKQMVSRRKRDAFVDPSGEEFSTHEEKQKEEEEEVLKKDDHPILYQVEEVFSTLTDGEIDAFSKPVANVLIPSLIHFEGMIISQLESMHSTLISHELRLEEIEKVQLTISKSMSAKEPQSDAVDNKTELEDKAHILEEGLLPVDGTSNQLEDEGSGDVDWSPTKPTTTVSTTNATTTTASNFDPYEMYRELAALEQKYLALENYNVVADSELKRARSEVIKMDDKVTELDRRYRNLQVRTKMHSYKIHELDMFMGKSEVLLHAAVDSFSRVNIRLDSFKDRLIDFKHDLHAVSVKFMKQDQISNELRAADSVKAHDIQELRKSVMGVEGRLSGLYMTMEQNVDTIRNDMRTLLDGLCSANNLSC